MTETGWEWWSGSSDEYFTSSHDTREEAIAALDGEGGYIVEARQDPIKLSNFIDADYLLEWAEENVERSENLDAVFDVTPQQEADLGHRLREACDQWQLENGLVFHSDLFTDMRNAEGIDADPV